MKNRMNVYLCSYIEYGEKTKNVWFNKKYRCIVFCESEKEALDNQNANIVPISNNF